MKIFEISEHDLLDFGDRNERLGARRLSPSSYERAVMLFLKSFETANQAGLDGKRLSDISLVERLDPVRVERVYEVRAKVTHRLSRPTHENQAPIQ